MVSPISSFSFSLLSPAPMVTASGAGSALSATPAASAATPSQSALAISPASINPFVATSAQSAVPDAVLAQMLAQSPNANPFLLSLGGRTQNTPTVTQANTPTFSTPNIQTAPQLQQSIAKIQQDPTGAQLLQAALSKGYSIRLGNPAAASNEPLMRGVTVEGVTLSNSHQIILSPNAPDFDKTLVHELYHAATDNNGDSKLEEATANIIGDAVSADVNHRPRNNPLQILQDTLPLYPNLPLTNP